MSLFLYYLLSYAGNRLLSDEEEECQYSFMLWHVEMSDCTEKQVFQGSLAPKLGSRICLGPASGHTSETPIPTEKRLLGLDDRIAQYRGTNLKVAGVHPSLVLLQ